MGDTEINAGLPRHRSEGASNLRLEGSATRGRCWKTWSGSAIFRYCLRLPCIVLFRPRHICRITMTNLNTLAVTTTDALLAGCATPASPPVSSTLQPEQIVRSLRARKLTVRGDSDAVSVLPCSRHTCSPPLIAVAPMAGRLRSWVGLKFGLPLGWRALPGVPKLSFYCRANWPAGPIRRLPGAPISGRPSPLSSRANGPARCTTTPTCNLAFSLARSLN